MNNDLKKKKAEKYARQKRYMERHKTLCVTLNKSDDADIIDWLDKQENRSESVREALRKEAKS